MPIASAVKHIRNKIKKIFIFLFFCVCIAEILLQAWGYLYTSRFFNKKLKIAKHTENTIRILCVGDSSTQGCSANMETESYPARLQELLHISFPDKDIHVINLGMAGINSSQLLNSIPAFIRQINPHIIVVMIGMNDPWNLEDSNISLFRSKDMIVLYLKKVIFKIKLYKLLKSYQVFNIYKHLKSLGDRRPLFLPETRQKGIPVQTQEGQNFLSFLLKTNITSIVNIAHEHGVKVILMSYHRDGYGSPNALLKRIYKDIDVPNVELSKQFTTPDGLLNDALISNDAFHSNAEGYKVIAQTLFPIVSSEIQK